METRKKHLKNLLGKQKSYEWSRKQNGIYAVEDAAMARQQGSAILHSNNSFEVAFEEITSLSKNALDDSDGYSNFEADVE